MPEEMLDSGSDSDPEKPVLRQIAKDHQQAPSKEQDRESLLRELGQFSFTTLEEYKAANAERLKRCYMADERDQNRNILHWLSVHLPSNPTDDENTSLHWLVTTVVELEPKIVTMVATDSQKANCLQTAIEHARFDLIESLFKTSDDEALRVAISQGNHCNETCLHLAVRLGPPGVGLTLQLLENAHPKAILKQRKYRFEDDKPNHGNTVLHDFVHINVCFVKGYMKTLRRFIQLCPEALKVSNAAKESPFQFHIATRNKVYPDWQGLEFSPRTERHDKKKEAAAKVGRLLLDEAFSQSTWEDACGCVYGEKTFNQATTFRPAAPINKRIDRSHSFLQFYPILSYVELVLAQPNPQDRHGTSPHQSGDHIDITTARHRAERTESIKRVFSWFRKQKVKRILNLVVRDDARSPCSDAVIEECLRDFDVRYLQWTKDDLCIEVLHNAGLSNVKELWLQWSGRNSVLYSWSCKDTGLPKLPQLEMVHIHTRAGIESPDANKNNLKNFNTRLKESIDSVQIDEYQSDLTTKVTKTLQEELSPLGSKLQASMSTWSGGPDYVQIAKVGPGEKPPMIEATIAGFKARAMFDRQDTKGVRQIKVDDESHETLSEANASKADDRQEQKCVENPIVNAKQASDHSFHRGHRWLDAIKRLKTAINIYKQNNQLTVRPIRVALLDDGVNPGELVVPGVLKDGWPLPSTSRLHSPKPYYSSDQGHGTKMARLLYFMCPFISIYVAKIDMYREHDTSAAMSAAKAINWAVSKNVDIISMSWTVKQVRYGPNSNQTAITALERAIQAAANSDILLFCAVQDSGHYENDEISFPQKSDTKKLIIVGSANENGDKSTFVNENSFNYLFPGEIVIPDILTEHDKGSSVATAVAAGMAAMILWCAEYHAKTQDSRGKTTLPSTPATTLSPSLAIPEPFETGLRTATEWDFRRDGRMSALFDALKPDNDKFVDITSMINSVMASVDEFHDTDLENQKSCIEAFVSMCKGNLPLNRR
uniref:Peptidase S8/S53 domain-containing protein n=1 Tax=Gibberella zeae TaxID=5518 RepID=A0A4E9DRG0_GIBZA